MIPFKTQYDKIVGAYLRNELNPLDNCACFIGNLLNNTSDWADVRTCTLSEHPQMVLTSNTYQLQRGLESIEAESNGMYTPQEIVKLENVFLDIVYPNADVKNKTEETLFKAMTVTLEQLRDLHESKGEVIENYVFTKRELV